VPAVLQVPVPDEVFIPEVQSGTTHSVPVLPEVREIREADEGSRNIGQQINNEENSKQQQHQATTKQTTMKQTTTKQGNKRKTSKTETTTDE
jgi:hypothetical protein